MSELIGEESQQSNAPLQVDSGRKSNIRAVTEVTKEDIGKSLNEFKGSPKDVMVEVLEWIKEWHGSLEKYLVNVVGIGEESLAILKQGWRTKFGNT